MRLLWGKMVLHEPHAGKAHVLGETNLLDDLLKALVLALRGPGFGNLYLVDKGKLHAHSPSFVVTAQQEKPVTPPRYNSPASLSMPGAVPGYSATAPFG